MDDGYKQPRTKSSRLFCLKPLSAKMPLMKYWLLKSEPGSYSIDDFKKDKITDWTGVRNYQARNFIREMKSGDKFLFYHSNSAILGIYGVGEVVSSAFVDPTALDKKDSHFDPKSKGSDSNWRAVKVKFKNKFKEPFSLYRIKSDSLLSNMIVAQKGSRLSVMPVEKDHFNLILNKSKIDK